MRNKFQLEYADGYFIILAIEKKKNIIQSSRQNVQGPYNCPRPSVLSLSQVLYFSDRSCDVRKFYRNIKECHMSDGVKCNDGVRLFIHLW